MTENETLTPGRELDRQVGEALGYKVVEIGNTVVCWVLAGPEGPLPATRYCASRDEAWKIDCPRFSTDLGVAMTALLTFPGGQFSWGPMGCVAWIEGTMAARMGRGDDPCLAICAAILRTKGEAT